MWYNKFVELLGKGILNMLDEKTYVTHKELAAMEARIMARLDEHEQKYEHVCVRKDLHFLRHASGKKLLIPTDVDFRLQGTQSAESGQIVTQPSHAVPPTPLQE